MDIIQNIEKIGEKIYKEVDKDELNKKLDNLLIQKANINYNALEEAYINNVSATKEYEKNIDIQIEQIKGMLNTEIHQSIKK